MSAANSGNPASMTPSNPAATDIPALYLLRLSTVIPPETWSHSACIVSGCYYHQRFSGTVAGEGAAIRQNRTLRTTYFRGKSLNSTCRCMAFSTPLSSVVCCTSLPFITLKAFVFGPFFPGRRRDHAAEVVPDSMHRLGVEGHMVALQEWSYRRTGRRTGPFAIGIAEARDIAGQSSVFHRKLEQTRPRAESCRCLRCSPLPACVARWSCCAEAGSLVRRRRGTARLQSAPARGNICEP